MQMKYVHPIEGSEGHDEYGGAAVDDVYCTTTESVISKDSITITELPSATQFKSKFYDHFYFYAFRDCSRVTGNPETEAITSDFRQYVQ